MSQVLEILTSLGIDSSFFYQFIIFFVAFIAMNFIVFRPYLKAHDERVRRTLGGQEEAKSLLDQAEKAEETYKAEAKKLNAKIKEIFSKSNNKAKDEVDSILAKAKEDADKQIEAGRKALSDSVSEARKAMETYIPDISEKIQNKFLRQ